MFRASRPKGVCGSPCEASQLPDHQRGNSMQCASCREEIIEGAAVCRFCGRDQPAEAERKARKRRLWTFISIVGIICVTFTAFTLWYREKNAAMNAEINAEFDGGTH